MEMENPEDEENESDIESNFDLTKAGLDAPAAKDQFYGTIEKNPCLVSSRRRPVIFTAEAPIKHTHPAFKNVSVFEERLKAYVHKKSLEALVQHPSSSSSEHVMKAWSGVTISSCRECEGLLVGPCDGIERCTRCGIKVHSKCTSLLYDDCLQDNNQARACKKADPVERMKMIEKRKDNKNVLETLRKIFKTDLECHERQVEEAIKVTSDPSYGWLAEITIRAVCAKGLAVKDCGGSSDPYVTIQIGRIKKMTKVVRKDVNPVWNESFNFKCQNYRDKIKVRVWDKDSGYFTKNLFKSSGDDFMGQKIIDLRTVLGESDHWYTLEKRSDKTEVSGSIRLEIKTTIAGEDRSFNCHMQYACLHECAFHYFSQNAGIEPSRSVVKGQDLEDYFDEDLQEIVDEFAKRYEIELLFRIMVHFSCLCEQYTQPGVLNKLKNLLRCIKSTLEKNKTPSFVSKSDKIVTSNFGKWNFVKVLDQLNNCLRITLSLYRDFYPPTDNNRLSGLINSVDLLIDIANFKAEFLEMPKKASDVLRKCIDSCLASTYTYLFSNCSEIYGHIWAAEQKTEVSEEGPGCKRNLKFWYKLVALIASTIEDDSNVYSRILNRFPKDFNLEQISSSTLWNSFKQDLSYVLEEHLLETRCQNHEYVNLYNRVNELYNKYFLPYNKTSEPPEYPIWFEPFINRWLKDNDKLSVTYAISAYTRDKEDQFQKVSKQSLFSCSVTDVLTQLNQCYEVVSTFASSHLEVGPKYILTFSLTIEKVLLVYTGLLSEDFPTFLSTSEIACVFMNNIQQLRIELERLFFVMGGKQLHVDVICLLNELQRKLSRSLDHLVALFCGRLKICIDETLLLMRDTLAKQGSNVGTDKEGKIIIKANQIMSPLFDYLDSILSMLASQCLRTVLRRILKELWTLVLKGIECFVVLPLISIEGKQPSEVQRSFIKYPLHLTTRQREILEAVLDILKKFFWAHNKGLRMAYLVGTPSYIGLIDALILISQTTDVLIKVFIDSQRDQESDESFGILSMNIQIAWIEKEITLTLKVESVENINWPATKVFQPYVQATLLGPCMSGRKRSQTTKSISNEWSPKFNETFRFSLGSEADLTFYEVQFCLKDFCFVRRDMVVGIAVFPLRTLVEQRKEFYSCQIPLKSSINVDNIGDMVLRALSQRHDDEMAKEFVRTKMELRHKS